MDGHRCGVRQLQPAGLPDCGHWSRFGVPGYRRGRGDHTCVSVRLAHASPAADGDGLCRDYVTLPSDRRISIRVRPLFGTVQLFRDRLGDDSWVGCFRGLSKRPDMDRGRGDCC